MSEQILYTRNHYHTLILNKGQLWQSRETPDIANLISNVRVTNTQFEIVSSFEIAIA